MAQTSELIAQQQIAAGNGGKSVIAQVADLAADIFIQVRHYKTGANTWQDALQLALNYADSIGGGTVILPKRTTIDCLKVGTKNTDSITADGSLQAHSYCIEIGNNISVDLNESTVRLQDSQNASLFVTKNMLASATAGTNIAVYNGTFDMNCQNQTNPATSTMDAITFFNVVGLRLENIKYKNIRTSSFKLLAVKNFFIDNQFTSYSDGDAYRMGATGTPYELRCQDGTIGTLEAENCSINKNGSLQGNPVIASIKNVAISQLRAKGCGGGFKFQEGCENLTIGRAVFNGALVKNTYNSSVNSGFKLQGVGSTLQNITIGEIISTDCQGEGLYIEATKAISIGKYVGIGNGTDGTRSDVRIGNSNRVQITDITSTNAGGAGVELRTDLTDYQIGSINILNPGTVANNVGVTNSAVNGTIRTVIAKDDRTTKQMTYGFSVPATTPMGTLFHLEVSGALTLPFKFDSAFYEIKKIIMDNTASTHGQITLSAGTSTTVSNNNAKAFTRGAPGYNVPVIELIAVNAAARTLLTKPLTYTVSTSGGFTIQHPTATGTEQFIYRLSGYILALNNLA